MVNGGPLEATLSSDLTFEADGRVAERITGQNGTTTVSLMYTGRGRSSCCSSPITPTRRP